MLKIYDIVLEVYDVMLKIYDIVLEVFDVMLKEWLSMKIIKLGDDISVRSLKITSIQFKT